MNKILIIGQAPPAVKQSVPYDTTLLYEMLSWVGITKEESQSIFEFEAVSNIFPGHSISGHNKPSVEQMGEHWEATLKNKVELAEKVWLLGNVARDYFYSKPKTWSCNLEILETVHPSKRNHSRIFLNKDKITAQLKNFIQS